MVDRMTAARETPRLGARILSTIPCILFILSKRRCRPRPSSHSKRASASHARSNESRCTGTNAGGASGVGAAGRSR